MFHFNRVSAMKRRVFNLFIIFWLFFLVNYVAGLIEISDEVKTICGKPRILIKFDKLGSRIFNGDKFDHGNYPWHV